MDSNGYVFYILEVQSSSLLVYLVTGFTEKRPIVLVIPSAGAREGRSNERESDTAARANGSAIPRRLQGLAKHDKLIHCLLSQTC